jgi:CRISPR-associated protein Cas1
MPMILRVGQGEKIKVTNNKLVIVKEYDENFVSLKDIKAIIIENLYSSITIKALLELNRSKVLTLVCNEKHQPELQILDLFSNYKVTERINEQVMWKKIIKEKCFKEIIGHKILNQVELLEYLGLENDDLKVLKKKILHEDDLNKVKALEGTVARIYFQRLYSKKFKRFNMDPINSALNYGYSLLRSLIVKIIAAKGLHPSLGIEHHSMFNNYNLAEDIIEVFRPMVDYLVYLYFDKYSEFNKEFRSEILKVLFFTVKWNNNSNTLEYSIGKYVDVIIAFLNEKENKLFFPELEIEEYGN